VVLGIIIALFIGVFGGFLASALRRRRGLRFTVGSLLAAGMIGLGAAWLSASLVTAHDNTPTAEYPCLSRAFPYVHACRAGQDPVASTTELSGVSHRSPVEHAKDAVKRQWTRLDEQQRDLSHDGPVVVAIGAGVTIAAAAFVALGRRRVSMS
jgi:hypothetical protein